MDIKYYKKRGAMGVVMRAYVGEDNKYRFDIKRAVAQFVARGRNHSDSKAGILETNRVFEDKQEANKFFKQVRDNDDLIPATISDWESFSVQ